MPIMQKTVTNLLYNYTLPVREIIRLSPSAAAIRLNLDWNPFDFLPGQYAQLEVEMKESEDFKILNNESKIQKRSYSITSSPNEKRYLEFTIKEIQNGFFSKYMVRQLSVGDLVKVKGPQGIFVFDKQASNLNIIFLAAGSGISPMISILRYIDENKINVNLALLYSNKTEEEILWKKEIELISSRNQNIKHLFTLTQQQWQGRTGRIDKNLIFQYCTDIEKTDFYLCGPPPFVREMEKILKESGIQESSIKKEMF